MQCCECSSRRAKLPVSHVEVVSQYRLDEITRERQEALDEAGVIDLKAEYRDRETHLKMLSEKFRGYICEACYEVQDLEKFGWAIVIKEGR